MFTGEKRGHYRSEPRGWSSHLITRKGNHPGQLEIPQGPGAEWQICHQLRQEEESWRLRWNRRGTKGEKKKRVHDLRISTWSYLGSKGGLLRGARAGIPQVATA